MSAALSVDLPLWWGAGLWWKATESRTWMHSRRWWIGAVVLVASALDLMLTQTILTFVHGLQGDQPAEANPVMARVVMTWWAWPIRVGVPALVMAKDFLRHRYGRVTMAATLYWCVVVWNTHMLWSLP